MIRLFFILLASTLCFATFADAAFAFGESEDGGCCGALSDESLARVADAYDVPYTVADHILNAVLSTYSNEELRMLHAMPGEACRTQPDDLCELMPDEFFRFLVEEKQARRADITLTQKATWDFWRTVFLFVLSIIGAALGVFNTWHGVRSKGG